MTNLLFYKINYGNNFYICFSKRKNTSHHSDNDTSVASDTYVKPINFQMKAFAMPF